MKTKKNASGKRLRLLGASVARWRCCVRDFLGDAGSVRSLVRELGELSPQAAPTEPAQHSGGGESPGLQ